MVSMLMFLVKKSLAIAMLCSSGMVFMFIPRCSPNKHPLDVEVMESFQCDEEKEEFLGKKFVESEICISDKE